MGSLEAARHRYAEELRSIARVSYQPVIDAFAQVPRERFVGPGPWQITHLRNLQKSMTPDDDPRHLYHDVLVTLDAKLHLNNGSPSLWAMVFDRLTPKSGEHAVHIGTGSGYYTSVLAEMVGEDGTVTGIEVHPALAPRAKANLADRKNVKIIEGDGTQIDPGAADLIVVNAGATHLIKLWVDSLRPGGRLLVPLTADYRGLPAGMGLGALLRITRNAEGFVPDFLGPVGIYHCHGARSAQNSVRLKSYIEGGLVSFASLRTLRGDRHEADDSCWLHGPEICLSQRAIS